MTFYSKGQQFSPSCSRTYVREKSYLNETSTLKKDSVFTHRAIFEKTIRFEEIDQDLEFVTSCVTLMSQGEVPAGTKYSVIYYKDVTNTILHKIFSAWHVYQCDGGNKSNGLRS